MGMLSLSGNRTESKAIVREPARLGIRGRVAFITRPSNTLPAGMTTCESDKIGSSRRAWISSPMWLFDAVMSSNSRTLQSVPAGSTEEPEKPE